MSRRLWLDDNSQPCCMFKTVFAPGIPVFNGIHMLLAQMLIASPHGRMLQPLYGYATTETIFRQFATLMHLRQIRP
eukprot:1161521-Pelagomonas_calceolata.AAC.2